MASQKRNQKHELQGIAEDLLLTGGSTWRAYCTCSWSSRPCTSAGVARGLFRRHIVVAGRGLTTKR